jgi:hypothetical protein
MRERGGKKCEKLKKKKNNQSKKFLFGRTSESFF